MFWKDHNSTSLNVAKWGSQDDGDDGGKDCVMDVGKDCVMDVGKGDGEDDGKDGCKWWCSGWW